MPSALALDVGTKTIGVAATDPLGILASPLRTLSRQSVVKDAAALAEIVRERGSEVLVVGLPLELDSTEARSARLARQVGDALGELTGLPVVYQDERYTSVQAERQLIAMGMKRKKRKAVIDQQAAVLILQSWIDDGSPVEGR
jgi:putative Holliday junction resolvase